MKNKLGAILRLVLVILMGATTAMTLLGAVGTTCLAFNGDKYGPAFKWIVPYMPTYQTFVYVSLVAGIAATLVCYAIVRGDRWFYLGALITLFLAGGAAAVQMYYTSSLRHIPFFAAAPTNIRFIITLVTLIAFAIVRLPGLWNRSGLGNPTRKPGSPTTAGGAALIIVGLLFLSAPFWAGPSHTVDGYNLVNTLEVPLLVDGVALVAAGIGLITAGKRFAALKLGRSKSLLT